MFIDDDINKNNIQLCLNQDIKSHYEIEDFRDYKSIDSYLQELINDFSDSNFDKEINNWTIESVIEELNEI